MMPSKFTSGAAGELVAGAGAGVGTGAGVDALLAAAVKASDRGRALGGVLTRVAGNGCVRAGSWRLVVSSRSAWMDGAGAAAAIGVLAEGRSERSRALGVVFGRAERA